MRSRGIGAIVIAGLLLMVVMAGRSNREDSKDPPINARKLSSEYPHYQEWPFNDETARKRQSETAFALGIPVEARIELGEGVYLDLVLVPAGRFVMGLKGTSGNEPHEVVIGKPFYIGKYETTWRQYLVFKQDDNITNLEYEQSVKADRNRLDLPLNVVSWTTCRSYCQDVSTRLGVLARLPLEAEWEFACRAGTTGKYIWSDYVNHDDANVDTWLDKNGKPAASGIRWHQKGGSFRQNPWGIYDMVGNVAEWVYDKYSNDENVRTIRGVEFGTGYTVAQRMPELAHNSINAGFRIVIELDDMLLNLLTRQTRGQVPSHNER